MVQRLAPQGVRVPEGFATTAAAYRSYIEANGIGSALAARMQALKRGAATLHETGEAARRLFLDGEFPPAIAQGICDAYKELSRRSSSGEASVAVRSSATAEDLPEASFAGQQETFLNVRGERELLDACRRCYASLFTDRAISYRETKGFDHLEVALSIGVQRMVRSDLAGSGVMFSIDTESGFPRVAVINAAWGLGETVVQGSVDPDKYIVFKPLLDGCRAPSDHREDARRQGTQDGVRQRRECAHADDGNHAERAAVLRPERRRDSAARPLGRHRGGALRPRDGHGVGQGRRDRRPLHGAGAPGNGAYRRAAPTRSKPTG